MLLSFVLKNLAGFPTQIWLSSITVFSGITDPAPIKQLSPILQLDDINAPVPMKQLLPIFEFTIILEEEIRQLSPICTYF